MKREEIFAKIFELEFCEIDQKPHALRELEATWQRACEETRTPVYVLKPAILKLYPIYRAKRFGNEMPDLPFEIRGQ